MTSAELQALLRSIGVQPARSLGQNFLTDDRVVSLILDAADLTSETSVLEVGPGLGAITTGLLERARYVVGIEKDNLLAKWLQENVAVRFPNCHIIHADAREVNFSKLFPDEDRLVICANLPYAVTSDIVTKLLIELPRAEHFLLMMQREAAQRLLSQPKSKEYGPLPILIRLTTYINSVMRVGGGSFYPPPRVTSEVLSFRRLLGEEDLPTSEVRRHFFDFLTICFGQRRKTLANNLKRVFSSNDFGKESFHRWCAEWSLNPRVLRPEELEPKAFLSLWRTVAAKPTDYYN